MELKFLGRGASLNPEEGNTSAYFIDKGDLFLIDCGVTIYQKLLEKDLINSVNNIYLLVTHTHPDHFGSAGILIINYYWGNKQKKKINIILPKNAKHKINIDGSLINGGCPLEIFNYIEEENFDNKYDTFQKIRYVETKHCDDLAACYGLFFTTKKGIIYYSGDTCEVDTLKKLIASGQPIDKIYMDTSYESNPVHLDIDTIKETVPEELKSKVYCMHLNDTKGCTDKALTAGFNVVENDGTKPKTLVRK